MGVPQKQPLSYTSSEKTNELSNNWGGGANVLLLEMCQPPIHQNLTLFDYFSSSLSFCGPSEEFNVNQGSSYNTLRLLAFCTCLIRLLGAAFSTLRLSRYKEFIKQVGRTIRYEYIVLRILWCTI